MKSHFKISPRFKIISYLIVLFPCFFFTHTAHSQQTLILNTAFGPPISNESQTGFVDLVVGEGLRRIGYQLESVRMPAERALINANRGIDDGDISRVAGLQKKYPNLIQVPESILVVDMVLFTKNKLFFHVDGWNTVVSHSVAIISGWKIMEKNFGKLGDRVEIIKTDNAKQSFSLLLNNRVDFVAFSIWGGLDYLKKNRMDQITLVSPALAKPKFYVYLHKKHKKLVLPLAKAFKEMKKDGTFQTLFDKILKPYLQKKEKNGSNK